MHSVINFVELENRVIAAPVSTINSPMPNGTLRIRLTDSIGNGVYFLKALNAHGEYLARSADFVID